MLPVAVAWSSCDAVAIRYVLPVLWMTSCFTQWSLWSVVRISERRERNTRNYCIDSNQILLNNNDQKDSSCGDKICCLRVPCITSTNKTAFLVCFVNQMSIACIYNLGYFIPPPGEVQSISIGVCTSVHSHISKTTRTNFINCSVHATSCRDLILF